MPRLPAVFALLVAMSPAADPVDSPRGEREWVARYDGPSHRNDGPSAVAVSPDGASVFVSGTSYFGGRTNCSDFATVAYDGADGSQLWARGFNGAGSSCDGVAGMALSADGASVFVTGSSPGVDSFGDVVTVAYDARDGSEVWVGRQDGPLHGSDSSVDLFLSADARTVYVVGSLQLSECGSDLDPCEYEMATIAYDAASGAPRWVTEHRVPEGSAYASGIAGNGTMLFVSTNVSPGGLGQVVALDATTGVRRWVVDIEAYNVHSIAVTSDGGTVVVVGEDVDESRYAVTALSASDGSLLWRVVRGSPDFPISSLAVAPTSGSIYLALESKSDYLILSIDRADGSTIWRRKYAGSGSEDSPQAIITSPDGTRVYVTGSSGRSGSYRPSYATIAFDATDGAILWLDRYGGRLGGYHFASAIAATPAGGVVVTGESESPDGWADFATIKYAEV